MCGLIAALHYGNKSKEPVNAFIIDQYEEQHGRGTRGFGFVWLDLDGNIRIDRATEPVKALIDLNLKPTQFALFHHRTPTSTANTLSQTHPMVIEHPSLDHSYIVIHNGVIRNTDDLAAAHEALGISYYTKYETENSFTHEKTAKWNDSEALAVELARFIEGKSPSVATEGSAAFIVLQCDKELAPEKLFFGRNDGNPLYLSKTQNKLYLSSEGEGNEVDPYVLYELSLDAPEGKFKKRYLNIGPAYRPITTSTPLYPSQTPYQSSLLPVRADLTFSHSAAEIKTPQRMSPDQLLDIDTEDQQHLEPSYPLGIDDNGYYQEVQEYLDLFFTEIDDLQTVPDLSYYIGHITDALTKARDEAEKQLQVMHLAHAE